MYVFQNELDRLLELRCDAAVTAPMSELDKLIYMEALVTIAKNIAVEPAKRRYFMSNFAHSNQDVFIGQRYNLIMGSMKRKSQTPQILSTVLVVAMFVASFMVILQPAFRPPTEDIDGAFSITSDNAYVVVTDDKRRYPYINGQRIIEVFDMTPEAEPFTNLPIIYEEAVSE